MVSVAGFTDVESEDSLRPEAFVNTRAAPGSEMRRLVVQDSRDMDSKISVVILSYVTHYYYAALAAQRAGLLKRFITGIALTQEWQRRIINVLPMYYQNRVSNYMYYHLRPELVTPIWVFPAIEKLLIRVFPGRSQSISNTLRVAFDKISCKFVEPSDIFHFSASQGLYAATKAKSMGAVVIMDERGPHPRYLDRVLRPEYEALGLEARIPELSYLDRRIAEYALADYIIVPSEFAAGTLVAEGVEEGKIIVLPYGVDVSGFRPTPKQDDVFRVVFVGRVSIAKGVLYLLKAFKELKLPRSELVLIGRMDANTEHLMKEYDDHCKWLGKIPHSELHKYYSNGSIFVLPSLAEGSALVVYEAMACGLPVVVTANCGAVIEDGVHGFVIPPKDISALKDRIEFLYENKSVREEMGGAARLYVQEFTWDRYGERLVKVYHSVLAQKGRERTTSES